MLMHYVYWPLAKYLYNNNDNNNNNITLSKCKIYRISLFNTKLSNGQYEKEAQYLPKCYTVTKVVPPMVSITAAPAVSHNKI